MNIIVLKVAEYQGVMTLFIALPDLAILHDHPLIESIQNKDRFRIGPTGFYGGPPPYMNGYSVHRVRVTPLGTYRTIDVGEQFRALDGDD